MIIQTINPATEEVLQEYKTLNEVEIRAMIAESHHAFLRWRLVTFATRSKLMIKLAQLLKQKKDELSKLIAREMGKPLSQGREEILKCAWLAEHYADEAENYLRSRIIPTEMTKTLVCYQPLGVVFSIMPWNFPFWQVLRFAVPALMAGNTVILKHAPLCFGSGKAIVDLFIEAGFPNNVFQQAILTNESTSQVLAHPQIVGLSFTGSEKTGRIVASLAASQLKKMVLELGGNDPYLILEDADVELAAQCVTMSRLKNCGQVCIAAKRIIVHEAIYEELLNKIMQLMPNFKMGDPLLDSTTLGPMARSDLRETLHQQVLESIKKGAVLLEGGSMPQGPGFYYPPTLLVNVQKGMPAFDEELFGPVIALIKCSSEEDAIALANQSYFGLAAAVFTKDVARGEDIAVNKLEVGSCFVNAMVASDPRVPFGGIKRSGFGRELSKEGILEFVNTKSIAIK